VKNFYQALYDFLPVHSEEGEIKYSISCQKLTEKISEQESLALSIVEAKLEIIEKIFKLLALLNSIKLENENSWEFVSNSAYLMAKSILKTMNNEKQQWFDVNFWQSNQGTYITEQQRNVLDYMETTRTKKSQTSALPIRFIHVSCALIKIGEKILVHHREDKPRTSVNNYVLVGGKTNLSDVEHSSNSEIIKLLQSADIVETGLPHLTYSQLKENTLTREILEETSLLESQDYHYKFSHQIRYAQVQGTAANYAFTNYTFDLFHIQLTTSGYLKLSEKAYKETELLWFNAQEFSQTKAEELVFLKKLLNQDGKNIGHIVESLPASYQPEYYFQKNSAKFSNGTVLPDISEKIKMGLSVSTISLFDGNLFDLFAV